LTNKLKYRTGWGFRVAELFNKANKYRLSSQKYANRLNLAVVDDDAELVSSMIKMRVLSYNFDRAIKYFYLSQIFLTIKHAVSRVLYPGEKDTVNHFLYPVSFATPLFFEWSQGLTKSGQFGPSGLLEFVSIGVISYHFQFITRLEDIELRDLIIAPLIGICIKEICLIGAYLLSQSKNQNCHLGQDKKIYQKALLYSINKGNIDTVETLLSDLPRAILQDTVNQNGLSPLQIAVKQNNPQMFSLLIDNDFGIGFDKFSESLNGVDGTGDITPEFYNLLFLKISTSEKSSNKIKTFLNNPKFSDNIIISMTAIMGNENILDLLIDIKGSNLMYEDSSLLCHAIAYGKYDVVQKLIRHGADLNSIFLEHVLERAQDDSKKCFIKIAVVLISNQVTIDADLFRKNLINIDQILAVMSEESNFESSEEGFSLNKLELLCGIANLLIAEVAVKLIEESKGDSTKRSINLLKAYNAKLWEFTNKNITKIDFSEIKEALKHPHIKEFWQLHKILKDSLHILYKLKNTIQCQEPWVQKLLENIEIIEDAMGLFSLYYLQKKAHDESVDTNGKIIHKILGFSMSKEIGNLAITCQHPADTMEPAHLLSQKKPNIEVINVSEVEPESDISGLVGVVHE